MANPSRHSRSGDGNGWASPERTMVWRTELKKKQMKQVVVGVVYYLCRQDGQLDHPHFVHVHVPSDSDSDHPRPRLHLRDFIARLSDLRGAAMPAAYSWSAKTTYRRNAGYVWQDLTADDLIPAPSTNHEEYVLKGSPLLHHNSNTPPQHRRCMTSFDLADYHRTTDPVPVPAAAQQSLIGIDEISPPPSSSSPDDTTTQLVTLKQKQQEEDGCTPQQQAATTPAGRMRTSAMLMKLISCGASSIKELQGQAQSQRCRATAWHNNKPDIMDHRDYFSGSLLDNNTTTHPIDLTLRRSSSCNAHRGQSSRLGVVDQDGVPRRQQLHAKSTAARMDSPETDQIRS
ncbi:protein SOSEKI 5 [Oryza sativa Japonica Group]|uniref:Os01g0975000 protein n=3 Tax=Oryza sativa subsp. japonica TaxID=39947 RepID=Q0JFK4_ORYSJ|nr:uncharacterized protein LOC4324301 [Oryza sativa Japonica Group]KAF2954567.1 hypothetical protein DAI22_01g492300 [Oryza sativa Japonica Group]BAF07474.1 Os01g0975000 [Oryza sativa Japonica Group]BAS76461.1 Os01g0975000 [Oryza sativa Japonica Group]|eukprot:NP_001045560.1 Os01g0975000 [Oryza sativa Japonica Group]